VIGSLMSRRDLPVSPVEDTIQMRSSSSSSASDLATRPRDTSATLRDTSATLRDISVTPRDTSCCMAMPRDSLATPAHDSDTFSTPPCDPAVTTHDIDSSHADAVSTATVAVASESMDVSDISVTLPVAVAAVSALTSAVDSNQTVSSLVCIHATQCSCSSYAGCKQMMAYSYTRLIRHE